MKKETIRTNGLFFIWIKIDSAKKSIYSTSCRIFAALFAQNLRPPTEADRSSMVYTSLPFCEK